MSSSGHFYNTTPSAQGQGRPSRSTTSSQRTDPVQENFAMGLELLRYLNSNPQSVDETNPNQTNVDRAFNEVVESAGLTPEDIARAERLENPPAHLDLCQLFVYMVRYTASQVGSRNPATFARQ
ncbi:hypothetical protein CYLTODRAFT_446386 [Cylindrobasidium torrendii FP15055 ss-10]|uniref:Uncharacterized protein n=1 Tax=Cylindrobasidium torrendii FP15055 ss-10 TaxID=1314674 RepID=A0A0D7B004_9AGAR|nr:hypothetical protein CYLTODRAFT_446386 [Cylindrobasidium torrendii FP15055 ss-10]